MKVFALGLALATPAAGLAQYPYRPAPPPPPLPVVASVPFVATVPVVRPAAYYVPPPQVVVAAPPVVVAGPTVIAYQHPHGALTLDQFSRVFRPTPGEHKVWFVHPSTGRPVEVCFTLPDGTLREFEVNRHSVAFEFGGLFHHHGVRIDFHHNGTAAVKSH